MVQVLFCGKHAVGGTGSFSGQFGDEEASVVLVDGKRVSHFKNDKKDKSDNDCNDCDYDNSIS